MFLLSFDIEEFDMPFEYGKSISFEEQINISVEGTHIILDLLAKYQLKATFFSTVVFAENAQDIIQRIKAEGHELASHTYYHSTFEKEHLLSSKLALEKLSGLPVKGFRMPRMMPVDEADVALAGYTYNSSINPTWLPGRYNNLNVSRTYFKLEQVWQLPASVTPTFRIPLFWLSFHNFPLAIYKYFVKRTMQKDGYVNIYFHPWEFTDLTNKEHFGLPGYVSKNSGKAMQKRMEDLMNWIVAQNYTCKTISDFIQSL